MGNGRISRCSHAKTLGAGLDSFGPRPMADFEPCGKHRPGCCACSRCCRPDATGPAPNWPSGWSVTARTVRRDIDRLREPRLPGARHRGRRAATGWAPARPCRRCCSTTTKPSPSRSACAPPRAVGHRHRGDLGARAGQAGTGAAVPAAPSGQRSADGDGPDGRAGPTVDPGDPHHHRHRLPRPRRLRFDYRTHDGTRAIRTSEPHRLVTGPRLVPASAGTPTARTGAPSAWTASSRARPPAPGSPRAPPRARYQRLHFQGDRHNRLPLPGPDHLARAPRPRRSGWPPRPARWSRSTSTAASCGPAPTRSTSWPST